MQNGETNVGRAPAPFLQQHGPLQERSQEQQPSAETSGGQGEGVSTTAEVVGRGQQDTTLMPGASGLRKRREMIMEESSTVTTSRLTRRFFSNWTRMHSQAEYDSQRSCTSTSRFVACCANLLFERARRVAVLIVPFCRRRAPFSSTRSPEGRRAAGDRYRFSPGRGQASTPSAWTTNAAVVPSPTLVGRGSDAQDDPEELSLNIPERRNSAEAAQEVQPGLLMHDHPFRSAFVAYLTCFEGGPRSSSGDGGADGARTTVPGHRFEWQGHWQAEPLWFAEAGPTNWSLLNRAARVCFGLMRFLNFACVSDIGRSEQGEGDEIRSEVPESLIFSARLSASIFGRVDVKYFFRDTVYQQSNLPTIEIDFDTTTTTRATPSQTQEEVARSDHVEQHQCLCTNVDGENFFDEIPVDRNSSHDSDVDSSSSAGGSLVFLRCKSGRGRWKRRGIIIMRKKG